ncbi:MAG: RES family NAD+ phosphorylase, partial [Bacteroidia bacterium]
MKTQFPILENNDLPSLSFYQKAFEKFDCLIENIEDYKLLQDAFIEAFNTHPPICLSKSSYEDLHFYRARAIDTSKEDITQFRTFSYNPNKSAVIQGRSNIQGHPVFYGALSEATAICESSDKIEEGQELFISKWCIKKEKNYGFVNLIFNNEPILGEMVYSFNKHRLDRMKKMFDMYEEEKKAALQLFLTGVSNFFLRDNYKASSFLGHYYLYDEVTNLDNFKADLIIYPSVKSKYNSFNIAIRPDFVDSSMELMEVKKIRVNKFDDGGGAHVSLLNTGTPKNGKIQWYKNRVLLPENMRIKRMGIIVEGTDENINLTEQSYLQFAGENKTFS